MKANPPRPPREALLLLAAMVFASPGATMGEEVTDPHGAWVDFAPGDDPFTSDAGLDLRFLNERQAGEGGFVGVDGGRFVRERSGDPIRFWGVDLAPERLRGEALRRAARLLAKRGVNLVRIHGPIFDRGGRLEPERVLQVIEVVEAMKAEGIYSWLSVYFPLWLTPAPGTPWLEGYDGKTHPFAALMFNRSFEEHYRSWWAALLGTPSPSTGVRLVDEPAVAGVEIQNEDSFLFGTFDPDMLPEEQRSILEARFGRWLAERHGSIDQALDDWSAARPGLAPAVVGGPGSLVGAWRRGVRHLGAWWKGVALPRDAPSEGRAALRPPWRIVRDRTPRDQDTVRFLVGEQTAFYGRVRDFLRGAGFRGAITASNWTTVSPAVLGPLEKMSYLGGDFLDRHVYFDCARAGDRSTYQIREGHTYRDRTVLRLEAEDGSPLAVGSPVADPRFDGKPSAISEVSWTRPNRHRSEAPLFLAAVGANQQTEAIVHFALDSDRWSVQPREFMQPWSLLSPAMMGQFPAAAVLFRLGLVAPGAVRVRASLDRGALFRLEGAGWLPGDGPDALRAAGTPVAVTRKPSEPGTEPLVFVADRVEVHFTDGPGRVDWIAGAGGWDGGKRTVESAAGDLQLDLTRGFLLIDAPAAQGVSGDLAAAGTVHTRDLEIRSDLRVGHVVIVALDGQPLSRSSRMLLQVMSEERPTGFRSEPTGDGSRRITSLGRDPWQFRRLEGTVGLRRPDAAWLQVALLDENGYPRERLAGARSIVLRPSTAYYLITDPAIGAAR